VSYHSESCGSKQQFSRKIKVKKMQKQKKGEQLSIVKAIKQLYHL